MPLGRRLLHGAVATADELIAFCREGLAAFKRPRHVLLFDELPITATGKLQRFRIRELALERLSGAAAVPTPAAAGDDA